MATTTRRIPTLRTLAIACAVLVLAITTLSAFIRLSRAGLGCEPWPQCYGQQARSPAGAPVPVSGLVETARAAHRIAASAALLLIIAMVMQTLAATPVRWREGRLVLALLVLALFLAVLGRWTADSRLPAVVLGNLLAGFALVAVSWRLVIAASGAPDPAAFAPRWVRWAVALLVAQVALGGMVSAGGAGLSCPQLFSCDLSAGSWQALNPWHPPRFDGSDAALQAGSLVHMLHRVAGVLVAVVVFPLGIAAWRRGRRTGVLVLALLVLQVAAGAALVAGGLSLPVALAHNVLGALLLAAAASLLPPAARDGQEKVKGSPAGLSAR